MVLRMLVLRMLVLVGAAWGRCTSTRVAMQGCVLQVASVVGTWAIGTAWGASWEHGCASGPSNAKGDRHTGGGADSGGIRVHRRNGGTRGGQVGRGVER